MQIRPTEFDRQSIGRVYDEDTEIWWFSVIDVVQLLTLQPDDLIARKYWNQLKRRLANEGSQLVTSCHQLKMPDLAPEKRTPQLIDNFKYRKFRNEQKTRWTSAWAIRAGIQDQLTAAALSGRLRPPKATALTKVPATIASK